MTSTITTKVLDLRGASSPYLVEATTEAILDLSVDDLLEIRVTDRWSVPEFRGWCDTSGHALVERSEAHGVFRFVIRKTRAARPMVPPTDGRMAPSARPTPPDDAHMDRRGATWQTTRCP